MNTDPIRKYEYQVASASNMNAERSTDQDGGPLRYMAKHGRYELT